MNTYWRSQRRGVQQNALYKSPLRQTLLLDLLNRKCVLTTLIWYPVTYTGSGVHFGRRTNREVRYIRLVSYQVQVLPYVCACTLAIPPGHLVNFAHCCSTAKCFTSQEFGVNTPQQDIDALMHCPGRAKVDWPCQR